MPSKERKMGVVEEGQRSCVRFADFMLLPDESLLSVRLPSHHGGDTAGAEMHELEQFVPEGAGMAGHNVDVSADCGAREQRTLQRGGPEYAAVEAGKDDPEVGAAEAGRNGEGGAGAH